MQKKNAIRLKSQPDNRKNAFELKGQQTTEEAFREETILTNEKADYIMKYILC